jgi:SAM-dependent methyltransferase
MAVMSSVERWACSNAAWRVLTSRVVIPWVLAGRSLSGRGLEIGCGAGANAAALLTRFPDVHLVATDVDPSMLATARRRLRVFGDRATVRLADAAGLPFDDGELDFVVSLIMLHHVEEREAALAEAARVLRAGGSIIGYDLTRSSATAPLHRSRHVGHEYLTPDELRSGLADAGFEAIAVDAALGGFVARFSAEKRAQR